MAIEISDELAELRRPAPAIEKMGKDSGLPLSRLADLIPGLTTDILRTWHTNGANPSTDFLVEKAFLEINKYDYKNRGGKVIPLFIKGPPGQGKTTAYRVALQTIAKFMGVKLWVNPVITDKVGPNDIVLVEATLAGLLSPTSLVGIPHNDDGTTVYLPPARMKRLAEANFSLMVLDDLENAVPGVKNAAMPAILDKILIDFKLGDRCYVGATGNLGTLDGTNTTMGSDALFNRMETHLAYDTAADWIERARSNPLYQDEIGLCFLDEFFIQTPSNFYPDRSSKSRGPTATSRSYDGLLSTLRNEFGDHFDQEQAGLNPVPLISRLQSTIHAQIGTFSSHQLMTFYKDVLSLAYPAALETMSKARLSDDFRQQLTQLITQNKTTESEGMARSYLRQITAIASTQIFKILNQPNDRNQSERMVELGNVVDRYVDGLFGVGLVKGNKTNLIAQTCLNLAKSLIVRSENLPVDERYYDFGRVNNHGLPVLDEKIVNVLAKYSVSHTDKPYREGLLKVGGSNENPVTAVQSALIDPLTQTSEIVTLNQEVKDSKRMSM